MCCKGNRWTIEGNTMISQLLVVYLFLSASNGAHNSHSKKVIKLLALVPWPDSRENAGWDAGPILLPAGQVAIEHVNRSPYILHGYKLQLIEAGHEACGLTETNMALINFVKYACNPPYGTVAAVLGMFCSTSAIVMAEMKMPVVLKLSAANSPVFTSNQDSFHNFWRFLASASIYADMMIGLMDRFEWSRIAIVQDLETRFHSGIAEVLAKKILTLEDKEVVYHGGLVSTADKFIDNCISGILTNRARIIFVSATGPQTAKLLCTAADRKMTYPNYLWIIIDFLVSSLKDEASNIKGCNPTAVQYIMEGSIIGYFNIQSSDSLESSLNVTYNDYLNAYRRKLQLANVSQPLRHDEIYAGLLYDQVWALAFALNDALPILLEKNVVIEDIGFNQPEVTAILEESLSRISFHGVTGLIQFTENKEVPGSVDIYQVHNGLSVQVCKFGFVESTMNYSLINCSLSFSNELDDDIPVKVQLLGSTLVIPMYTATGLTIVFITIILLMMGHYRHETEIKASSFVMNILIFLGCYALCISQVLSTVLASVDFQLGTWYSIICNVQAVTIFSSVCLIFVTLFVHLLRINRIFHNKRLHSLGWVYNNNFLCIVTLLLVSLPIVIQIVFLSFAPFVRQEREYIDTEGSVTTRRRQYCCEINGNDKFLSFHLGSTVYETIFIILNIILASKTGSITQRQFRNAKKINIFMVSVLVIQSIALAVIYIFKKSNWIRYSEFVTFIVSFLIAILCQVTLFLPKVLFVSRQFRLDLKHKLIHNVLMLRNKK